MSLELLKTLPEFKDFNPATETLSMVKPIYGLKDAPRAWQQKLNSILFSSGMKQLLAEEQVFVLLETLVKKSKRILSTHVDDLKGGAKKAIAMALLAHIEKASCKLKQGWTVFSHTGIEHINSPGEVYALQQAYLNQLKPLDTALFRGRPKEELLSEAHTSLYMSLPGDAAWMILTRADTLIYVQALQRRAHRPRAVDARRLNVVLRFTQRHPKVGLRYKQLEAPLRFACFADAAFKAIPEESSGLALRGTAVLLVGQGSEAPASAASSHGCHLLEFTTGR